MSDENLAEIRNEKAKKIQHPKGKLTAYERLNLLLDEGSFKIAFCVSSKLSTIFSGSAANSVAFLLSGAGANMALAKRPTLDKIVSEASTSGSNSMAFIFTFVKTEFNILNT